MPSQFPTPSKGQLPDTPKPEPTTQAGKARYERERIHNIAQRRKADDKHDAVLLAEILATEDEARRQGWDAGIEDAPLIRAAARAEAQDIDAYSEHLRKRAEAAEAERDAANSQLAALVKAARRVLLTSRDERKGQHEALMELQRVVGDLPAAAQDESA